MDAAEGPQSWQPVHLRGEIVKGGGGFGRSGDGQHEADVQSRRPAGGRKALRRGVGMRMRLSVDFLVCPGVLQQLRQRTRCEPVGKNMGMGIDQQSKNLPL